ncbi:MAG: glycosyl hydrolase family 28-related protein [Microcoleaceae cyanobacterium]
MVRKFIRYHRYKKFWITLLGTLILGSLTVAGYVFSELLKSSTVEPLNSVKLESVHTNLSKPVDWFTQNSQPSSCGSPSSGPTDNAIAAYYGQAAETWTDQIRWNCVYNINDFPGSNLVTRFNLARDAATKAGGVVYFPAGTYIFTDSIILKNGVIIRGETPTIPAAISPSYRPETQFIFPKYEPQNSGNGTPNSTAFKKIKTQVPTKDSNIGLVNLDINRAAISILDDVHSSQNQTVQNQTVQNQNIIIFGIRSNNVAAPDPKVPDLSFQNSWQRYSYRFAANIEIAALQNILVANNRLNDNITDNFEQPGYQLKSQDKKSVITYSNGKKAIFHYGNHYGIVVNRYSKGEGFKLAATPQTEPDLFRKGIVIQDNWVYHTMRVGIQASGQGLVIKNNQIKDEPNKQWWLDPTGMKAATGAVTLENRGIDWSGWNVVIEGNQYEVYRHRIGDTGYLSVDGEGILIQECCGGTTVKNAIIQKNQGNAYIGLYKVREIESVKIVDNQLTNADILVLADTNASPYRMNNLQIIKNKVDGNIIAKASQGGKDNLIQNNFGNNQGKIEHSCHIQVIDNQGFEVKPCSIFK